MRREAARRLDGAVEAHREVEESPGTTLEEETGSGHKVHIRITQRNRRKCVVSVDGLAEDLDLKRICKALKKIFKCNGAVSYDDKYGEVIQIQGDHRTGVRDFLVDQEICSKTQIVVHGF